MNEKKTIKLAMPVTVFSKEISEVQLKEPKGHHIAKIGMPFILDLEGRVDFNTAKVGKYFDALAEFPNGTHGQLSAGDFLVVAGVILNFFGESPAMKT